MKSEDKRAFIIHRYSYDAENRLVLVETSSDSLVWQRDVRYEYYRHGPLARTVLGDQQVQGLDYAYTLQGWLKGINSTALQADYDMGNDGADGSDHQLVARDAFAIGLHYFGSDYQPIEGSMPAFAAYSGLLNYEYRPLYNGNISSMTSNIAALNAHGRKAQFYNYHYDQLNRLVGMDAYTGLNEATNSWTSLTAGDAYRERVRYDGNGNILRYVRHDQYGQPMDSLLYHYYDQRNQLRQVEDPAGSQVALGDMGNQSATNNYVYDPVGNMTGDLSEQMDPSAGHGVSWNVYGKITRITRGAATSLSQSSELQYGYDAAGNRVHKSVSRFNSSITDYTSYVRDAQGNILAIYTASGSGSDLSALDLKLSERELYGSSRLGSDVRELRVDSLDAATPEQGTLTFYRGLRRYELVNHLGNVLAVISDRKIAVPLSGSSLIAHYEPDVLTATDYYPFGMRMPGRQYGNGPVFAGGDYDSTTLVNGYQLPADLALTARPDRQPNEYVAATSIELLPGFSSTEGDSYQLYIADETYAGSGNQPPPGSADGKAGYRFGFNGQERSDEMKGFGNSYTAEFWEYDPRIGNRWNLDPRPAVGISEYSAFNNSPIWLNDPLGDTSRPGFWGGLIDFTEGGWGAVKGDAKGLLKFVASDAWNSQTWTNVGKNITALAIGNASVGGPGVGMANLATFDAKFGTDLYDRNAAFHEKAESSVNNIPNMNAKDWGSFTGHLAFAIAGTKGVNAAGKGLGALNRFAATRYLAATGDLVAFEKVEGFSLRLGARDFVYHNSLSGAIKSRWSTPTLYSSSKQAISDLALEYPGSQNTSMIRYSLKNLGFYVKGTASSQGASLGGGTQLLKTPLSVSSSPQWNEFIHFKLTH